MSLARKYKIIHELGDYDLFLESSSMNIALYRNDPFSLIRNIAQGACVEEWHRRAFNSTHTLFTLNAYK